MEPNYKTLLRPLLFPVKQNKYHAFILIEDTIIIAFICIFSIRKIENGLITGTTVV